MSVLSGEWFEDRWSETKLFLFALLCLLVLYGEYRFFFGDPLRGPSANAPGLSSIGH